MKAKVTPALKIKGKDGGKTLIYIQL